MKANRRIPTKDTLARLGYYARPIQAVVKKWAARMGEERLQHYYCAVASTILFRNSQLEISVDSYTHWPCVWELVQALSGITIDTSSPEYWLLTLPLGVATRKFQLIPSSSGEKNHLKRAVVQPLHYDSWKDIRDEIIKAGGPKFEVEALRQAGKRLRSTGTKSLIDEIVRRDNSL